MIRSMRKYPAVSASVEPVYGNLVGGAFASVEETFADTNPADPDDVVGRFPASGPAEVDAAVEAAAAALPAWRRTPPVLRGRHLVALARALREREDEIVAAITREQGKPLAESRGEFGKALEYLDYYGALALRVRRPPAAVGAARRGDLDPPRAARRRRAADAVERAASPSRRASSARRCWPATRSCSSPRRRRRCRPT